MVLEDDVQRQLDEALAGSKELDFLTTRAKERTGVYADRSSRAPFHILQSAIISDAQFPSPLAIYLGWLVVADLFCLARHLSAKPPKPFAVRCALPPSCLAMSY